MTMINPPFDKLVSLDEIEALRNLYTNMRVHPLVSAALHPGKLQSPDQISTNTCRALGYVLSKFPDWPRALKPRLVDSKDWTSSESALAEIRACGALIEAGFDVKLGTRTTKAGPMPEFNVVTEGIETIVEVWTRNVDPSEIQRIAKELAESKTTRSEGGRSISIATAVSAPFGMPDPNKKGDSVTTNTISRIARVKETEHQARAGSPFVVWVDLQNRNDILFDFSHALTPLSSWNGEVTSGAYWHALYGRKNDVLLEQGRQNTMLHEGRYYQTMKQGGRSLASAFIISSPTKTALLENPDPVTAIPTAFRNRTIHLPWLDISVSLVNWSEGLVEATLKVQRATVAAVIQGLTG